MVSGKNPKILLVDDEPSIVKACEEKFFLEGFIVITANSGIEAVDKAREYQPDVILLDLLIPSINGAIVLDRIKKSQKTSQIPIFIFSAMPEELVKKEYPKELAYAVKFFEKDKHKLSEIAKEIKDYLSKPHVIE